MVNRLYQHRYRKNAGKWVAWANFRGMGVVVSGKRSDQERQFQASSSGFDQARKKCEWYFNVLTYVALTM
jgi:hypothetical protein